MSAALPAEDLALACLQLNVVGEAKRNWPRFEALVRQAASDGAQLIITPECSNFIGQDRAATWAEAVCEEQDQHLAGARALATELGVWILLGSLVIKDAGAERLANRQFLIAPDGQIVSRYDKIHLFDVRLPGGETYAESQSYAPGQTRRVTPLGSSQEVLETKDVTGTNDVTGSNDVPWVLGHAICFDLRFPALFGGLARDGANLLVVPSAFTVTTGQAHWHVLLRARAIETGSYLCAPAQAGDHNAKRRSFGHSLIIDPWGEILAEASADVPGLIMARASRSRVDDCRARIPTLDLSQQTTYL